MGVVEARIQTVEEIYRLVWTAIASRQPISAIYKERHRLFCPHRLGRHRAKQLRVLCYQYGGESESGLAPVGSLALRRSGETAEGRITGRFLEDRTQSLPSGKLYR